MSANLYQKYRPQLLSEVRGQASVIKDLSKRIENNNFSQVMLFEGVTGTGKTTLQKIIAKNILCQHKDSKNQPCGVCEYCTTINEEKISNYYFERNASNLGIDDMRLLEELATKKTLSTASAKVFLIDELQELSQARTQKNLLKLIERPLKDTYFILGTMDISKIDKAIVARCTKYNLFPLTLSEISEYLLYICKQENISVDTLEKKKVIITLAENSQGSMRQAISNLERCIYSDLWTVEEVRKELSIYDNDYLSDMINQLINGKVELLNNNISKEILNDITLRLNLIYRKENGLQIYGEQKVMISGIHKSSIEILNNTIAQINELRKFPYLDKSLIDFTLINIIRDNKINDIEKPKERVVRR